MEESIYNWCIWENGPVDNKDEANITKKNREEDIQFFYVVQTFGKMILLL